jgi:DNA-binding transcriptional LysR family regulator
VAAHGGFAPAGRVLRQFKAKLSRWVAALEARLGVRLIERDAPLRVTEVGKHSMSDAAIVLEVEQAEAVVAQA